MVSAIRDRASKRIFVRGETRSDILELGSSERPPGYSVTVPMTSMKETCTGGDLDRAIDQFRNIVGAQFVHTGAAAARRGKSTTGIDRDVPAIVLPESEEEVVAIVKAAVRHRTPLYPVSTGRNWGYGCAAPPSDGCVVVELSRMRRLTVDRILGTATLQPGVTTEQLWSRLSEEDLPFMVPVTGAGPTTSIVGNALERGYGVTPHADHFGAVMSLTAVLPNGELFRPALADLGGKAVDCLHKWGVGPYLDGLFSQGSFGIVTEMTISLARRPPVIEAFIFELDSDTAVEPIVDAIRDLIQTSSAAIGGINLLNRRRLLSMTAPYPAGVRPGTVLGTERVDALAAELGLPRWLGFGGIYGHASVVRAVRGVVRRRLAPHCRRLLFFSEARARLATAVTQWLPGQFGRRLRLRAGKLDELLQVLAGRPLETALRLAYWRSDASPAPGAALDPSRDGCGLIWYAPLVPMRGEAVRDFVELVESTCPKFGIEPLITLTTVSHGAFDSTVPILFDRRTEASRAQDCYDTLLHEGRRRGFLPYRLGVDAMKFFAERSDAPYWRVIDAVKRALDPEGIISPGRYSAARGGR